MRFSLSDNRCNPVVRTVYYTIYNTHGNAIFNIIVPTKSLSLYCSLHFICQKCKFIVKKKKKLDTCIFNFIRRAFCPEFNVFHHNARLKNKRAHTIFVAISV